jgi:hypothetical protein
MGTPTVEDPHLRRFSVALRTRNSLINITKIEKGYKSEEKNENVKIVNFLHFHFTKARNFPNIVLTIP